METPNPAISRTAAAAFADRQQRARQLVANRGISRAAAEDKLRPWLAIACLAGADLPELAEPLAQLRTSGPAGEDIFSDAQARALVADHICPRARWAPMLGRARDEALRAADRFTPAGAARSTPGLEAEREAALTAARDLMRLAAAFAADPNGRHHVPPCFHKEPI